MTPHHHPHRSYRLLLSLAALLLTAAFADTAAAVYHPTLGRWVQRDPMGYVDGSSLYTYVRSAPTQNTDRLGLFAPPVPPNGGSRTQPNTPQGGPMFLVTHEANEDDIIE